jgi:hypothetical protein
MRDDNSAERGLVVPSLDMQRPKVRNRHRHESLSDHDNSTLAEQELISGDHDNNEGGMSSICCCPSRIC